MPLSARPSSSSFVNGPYTSAVSKNVTPRSMRSMNGRDGLLFIAVVGRAVRLAHAHAAKAEGGDGRVPGIRVREREHGLPENTCFQRPLSLEKIAALCAYVVLPPCCSRGTKELIW